MNKPPAFQFYPKDFLMDDKVIVMNLEEIGAYIKLLCYCWNNNGLTKDQKELKEMCGNPKKWERIWGKVGKCFYEKNGKLYNKRLDKELKKQKVWREKSRLGGIKSGISRGRMVEPNAKGGSKGGSTKSEPKGNSSSSSSSSSSIADRKEEEKKRKSPKLKFTDEHLRLSRILESNIKNKVPKHSFTGNNYLEKWANTFRIMEDKKEITSMELNILIPLIYMDKFWYKIILSANNLREHLGKLWEECNMKDKIDQQEQDGKSKYAHLYQDV